MCVKSLLKRACAAYSSSDRGLVFDMDLVSLSENLMTDRPNETASLHTFV